MKALRDPLGQFLILGGVLFGIYAIASNRFAPDESRVIRIDEAEIELLAGGWQRQWQRLPTAEELSALIDARIREEVLYREAQALGLDVNDVVVRRRMVQKMEMLSQDLALLADPSDAELRTFLDENRVDYMVPPRISFTHVYFNIDRRGAAAEADALQALSELRSETPPPYASAERGDRFMLDTEFDLQSPLEIRRAFGSQFADAITELEPGWHGPIASGYGIHLVNVTRIEPEREPEFAAVRSRLVNDFNRVRRERANEALYEGFSEGYTIVIDEDAASRRVLGGRGTGEGNSG